MRKESEDFLEEIINCSFNSSLVDDIEIPNLVKQISNDLHFELNKGIDFIRGFECAKDYTILILLDKIKKLKKMGKQDSEEMQIIFNAFIKVANYSKNIYDKDFVIGENYNEFIKINPEINFSVSRVVYNLFKKQKKSEQEEYDINSFIKICKGQMISVSDYVSYNKIYGMY